MPQGLLDKSFCLYSKLPFLSNDFTKQFCVEHPCSLTLLFEAVTRLPKGHHLSFAPLCKLFLNIFGEAAMVVRNSLRFTLLRKSVFPSLMADSLFCLAVSSFRVWEYIIPFPPGLEGSVGKCAADPICVLLKMT